MSCSSPAIFSPLFSVKDSCLVGQIPRKLSPDRMSLDFESMSQIVSGFAESELRQVMGVFSSSG